jgi:hypothetical protein
MEFPLTIQKNTMENTSTLKDNIENYIEHKVDLVKLKTADKAGAAASNIVVGLAMARLVLFILIFLSLSAAFAISQATGDYYLGFLIVAGFYMLVAGLLLALKEKLITMPIINAILKKLNYNG